MNRSIRFRELKVYKNLYYSVYLCRTHFFSWQHRLVSVVIPSSFLPWNKFPISLKPANSTCPHCSPRQPIFSLWGPFYYYHFIYTGFPSGVCVGRDSSVGIANRYGLTVRWSNPGGGESFRTSPHKSWGPSNLLYNDYWVSFPGLKRPRHDVNHPSHLALRLKKN